LRYVVRDIPTFDLERSVNAHWIRAMIYSIDFSIFERPFKSFGMAAGEVELDKIAEIGACVDITCRDTSKKFQNVLKEIRIMNILPSVYGIDQKLLILDDVIVQSHEEGVNLTQYLEDKIGLIVTVFYDNK
jgi:hypothetical protein